MQNQFIFPNQANNMNIMIYKQEIMKLVDEIIEIDLEIFQHQYNQQQMMNQFFMQYLNMMMPNMPFIQNQFMNPQLILEQKIKLYKEKFEKLTEEKMEKNKMWMSMKQMFPSFPLWNNYNFINPMNNPMNQNPMFNFFMQMNMMNNIQNPGMQQMNPSKIQNNQNVKNLVVTVAMEDGRRILVQCQSNDKLEIPIKNFLTKTQNSEDFDFFIITEKKANKNLTVEENGIISDSCYISARKKLKNSNENNIIEQNIQYNKEYKDKNDSNDNLEINPINFGSKINLTIEHTYDNPQINHINLGPKINLRFEITTGLKIFISIDGDKTFKEAVIMFCNKVKKPFSTIQKNIFFLFNAKKLDVEDNRKLIQISSGNNMMIICVVDATNIIGA